MRDGHRAFVESWLSRRGRRSEPSALLRDALAAVWSRARRGLSGVSLQALGRAARDAAAEREPLVSDVRVGPEGFALDGLAPASPEELRGALAALLVELLAVVEASSGDILAPALQAELLRVGRAQAG